MKVDKVPRVEGREEELVDRVSIIDDGWECMHD